MGANVLLNSMLRLATGEHNLTATTMPSPPPPLPPPTTSKKNKELSTSPALLTDIALLCIDLQQMPPTSEREGVDFNAEDVAYFNANIPAVLKQVSAAQSLARGQREKMAGGRRVMEVVHCRIMSMTRDGRDRSALHKRMKIHVPPPSTEADEAGGGAWMDGVGPQDDELVFHKTGSNAFVTTNLHYVLGNLGIRRLAVVGVLTDECVAGTVKAAADLGYECAVLADACLAAARDRHDAALATVGRFATVTTTAEWLKKQERSADSLEAADGAGRRG